jgi:hypothetical protein
LLGSAVMYRTTWERSEFDEIDLATCDFKIDLTDCSSPDQLRNPRKKNFGLRYKKGSRSLIDDLVVLFGPKVSAKDAVYLLRSLSDQIERDGLLVSDNRDEYMLESARDGTVTSA